MMRIKKMHRSEISWFVLFLGLSGLVVNWQIQIFIFFFFLLYIVIESSLRKRISINENCLFIYIYIFVVFLMSLRGLLAYNVRFVIRDFSYAISTILVILISINLSNTKLNIRILLRTIMILAIIYFSDNIIRLVLDWGQITMRECFVKHSQFFEFFVPILFYFLVVKKQNLFSKGFDYFIFGLCILSMFLSLGRTIIFGSFIAVFLIMILELKNKGKRLLLFKTFFWIVIVVAVFFIVIPEENKTWFILKITNSFHELSFNSSINGYTGEWRSFENYSAISYFRTYNTVEFFFGKGFGTLVPISYVPAEFGSFIEIQNNIYGITLLHNSFFTLLVKGGMLGFISYIALFVDVFFKGLKSYRSNNGYGTVLMACSIALVFNSIVVRGLYEQGCELETLIVIYFLAYSKNMADLAALKTDDNYFHAHLKRRTV